VPGVPIGRRPAVATLLAVVLAATSAACADEAEPSARAQAIDGVAAALETIPAGGTEDGDAVVVTYGDLAAAAAIAGVEAPADTGDDEAVVDYLGAVTGVVSPEDDPAEVAVLLPAFAQSSAFGDIEAAVDDVGFSILEVGRFVERATVPETVAVLDGEFDEDRMAGALDDAGDGVWVAGDPDGDLQLDDTSPVRPTGAPLWLALDGGRLVVTGTERDMTAALDGGGGDTLAGDEALVDLAHALDVYDAYSAMLVAGEGIGGFDPAVALGDEVPDDIAEQFEEFDACTGVTGAATGVAHDGRPLIVLAVASASADAAAANEELLARVLREGQDLRTARPWSELLDIETIGTEGAVTTITARPADMVTASWRNLLVDRTFPPC
jgi:hypothetical protein